MANDGVVSKGVTKGGTKLVHNGGVQSRRVRVGGEDGKFISHLSSKVNTELTLVYLVSEVNNIMGR